MLKVRFRLLLPLLMTATQLVLFAISVIQHPAARLSREEALQKHEAIALQEEGGTVTFTPALPPPASNEFKVALILNLPAVFLGGVIASFFPGAEEAQMIGMSVLFVPLVWYAIGRWMDRLLSPATLSGRKSLARSFGRAILRAGSALLLFYSMVAVALEYPHQVGDKMFISAVLCVWCGGYLACSILGDRFLTKRRMHAQLKANM